jgi:hypothetical protein
MQGFEEHASGAAGRIIDGVARFRGKNAYHESNDRARSVKLSGFLVGQVSKFLDEIFVGLAENVCFAVVVSETQRRKVLDQIFEEGIGKTVFVCPLSVTEDSVQCIRVGLLDTAHSLLEHMTDIGAPGPDIRPMTAFGNLKAVILWKMSELDIPVRFFESDGKLFVVDVRDAFKKKQRENVCLEISRINWPAKYVCRFPQMAR